MTATWDSPPRGSRGMWRYLWMLGVHRIGLRHLEMQESKDNLCTVGLHVSNTDINAKVLYELNFKQPQ